LASSVTTLTATQFEGLKYPQQVCIALRWFYFPQFKTGTYTTKADETVSYNDFGAGIIILQD
jgi:hypothetical protein